MQKASEYPDAARVPLAVVRACLDAAYGKHVMFEMSAGFPRRELKYRGARRVRKHQVHCTSGTLIVIIKILSLNIL
jgi:hypothetical protein